MRAGNLSHAVLSLGLVQGGSESLSVVPEHGDAFLVHLHGVSSAKHLGHIEILLAVLLRIQLNGPLDELLGALALPKLDQQVCILVHDQSIVRESASAFVVQAHSSLKFQLLDAIFRLSQQLDVGKLSHVRRGVEDVDLVLLSVLTG